LGVGGVGGRVGHARKLVAKHNCNTWKLNWHTALRSHMEGMSGWEHGKAVCGLELGTQPPPPPTHTHTHKHPFNGQKT
jgi:hypothetical protein